VYEAHHYIQYRSGFAVGDLLDDEFANNDSTVYSWAEADERCQLLGAVCRGLSCAGNADQCTLRSRIKSGAQAAVGAHTRVSNLKLWEHDFSSFEEALDDRWGFIVREGLAPVWVSEFGFSHALAEDEHEWLKHWTNYVHKLGASPSTSYGGIDWSYWEFSGEQVGGQGRSAGDTETYGVVGHCFTAPANTAHFEGIQRFMEKPKNPSAALPVHSSGFVGLFSATRTNISAFVHEGPFEYAILPMSAAVLLLVLMGGLRRAARASVWSLCATGYEHHPVEVEEGLRTFVPADQRQME